MRVCFLVEELGRSGGVGVVLGHASRLAARSGFDVEILLTGRGAAPDAAGGVGVRPLGAARGERFDIAIATWWATARSLFAVDAGRRAVLLQSFEERLYPDHPFDRLAAAAVLDLPVHYLVVAPWMRDVIAALRPAAQVTVVPNGIDKDVFAPADAPPRDGPLRILVEGQPSLWFKGVGDALAATRAMEQPATVTVVAPDPGTAGDVEADRLVGGLDQRGMADLYREHDVLLKLSRVESLGLAPIEAFHTGLPCVVTPYTGHEEYVAHGENGFVAGFDDIPGTARLLDLLARDRALLARLRDGALATAASWPSAEASTDALADALAEVAAGPPPDAADAARSALATLTLAGAVGRPLLGPARANAAVLAQARAEIRELYESRDECAEMLEDARRQLEEVKASRAYRLALAGRGVLDRVRR